MRRTLSILLLAAVTFATPAAATKKALFDNFHAETAGNADWVIDNDQPTPVPAQSGITAGSPGTYWTGAISSWGVALVKQGYTVTTNTTALTYGNANNPNDLANFDVLIVDEPNTLFSSAEASAILSFVQGGGGLVAVSDHSGSDRNSDGADSPIIWNALDPSHLLGVHFGVAGDANNNIVQTSTNVNPLGSDLVTHGPIGAVTGLAFHNGTTLTLFPAANPSVRGEVWMNGLSQSSLTGVMCASASYGSGRVVFTCDSSPADDGSAQAGNTNIFNGWGEAGATDSTLFMNATLWVTRAGGTDVTPPTVSVTSPAGGETWKAGSVHAITWTATDNVGVSAVDLAYSTDGGASYPNGIATGLGNSGSFSWTVPNVTSSTVRVRATARDAALNSGTGASAGNFTIDRWTITASAGSGGSISPSGAIGVAQGASQSFSITANPGGSITGVTVDGGAVGAVSSYTFTNVTANHTIAASFSAPTTGPWPMASGNYSEDFADIANWTDGFASGVGATRYASVPAGGSGTIPNGTHTTASTATFVTGTTGGVQRGTGTLVLLSTGTTDNTSAAAVDLQLDFSHTNAGTLGFTWSTVFNSTGDRKGSMRVYSSPNGTTWTELAGAAVLNFTNNVAGSGSVTSVALPAALSNSATSRIRFYYYNGTGGTTGSRPKIAIDNVSVTGTPSGMALAPATDEFPAPVEPELELGRPWPNPGSGMATFTFTMPRGGSARLELLDLGGRRVWSSEGEFAAGTHSVDWSGDGATGVAPAGMYFLRLVTPWGQRTTRLARL